MKPRTMETRRKLAAGYIYRIGQRTDLKALDVERIRKVVFQMNQTEFAELLDVRTATVSAWECERHYVSRVHWLALHTLLTWWLADNLPEREAAVDASRPR